MPKPSKKTPARKPVKARKATVTSRAATNTSRAATKAPRADTKSAVILKLLTRPAGASIEELAAATDWQHHSVRGFLSGALKKKRRLDVTNVIVNGVRRYHVEQPGSGQ